MFRIIRLSENNSLTSFPKTLFLKSKTTCFKGSLLTMNGNKVSPTEKLKKESLIFIFLGYCLFFYQIFLWVRHLCHQTIAFCCYQRFL